MKLIYILDLALLHFSTFSFAFNSTSVASELRSLLSPSSSIFLPSDPDWAQETTQRFDSWNAPTYILSATPSSKEDIQKVVIYASRNNISFLATGKGHGYTGSLVALKNGIELDLRNFNSVSVDAASNTLTVGGSVSFADLGGPVNDAGKAIPVGGCSCVGMAGATLGGGIGFYSGYYGAISDSLLSAEVVLADGSLVTASNSENSDLFWAVKGAGSSFGVVSSLTYRVYDAPNAGQVMNADMTFPVSANGSLWELAKSWAHNQPRELSVSYSIAYNATAGQVVILANVIYAGPLAEGKALIQPLLNLQPQNLVISYLPWKDIPDTSNYGAPGKNCAMTSLTYIPHSLNLYQIDVSGLSAAVNLLNQSITQTPALQGLLVIFTQYAPYGFQLHPQNSSSFPHRDVISYVQIDGIALTPESVPEVDTFGRIFRGMLQKISGRRDLQVYTNFAHGDEGAAAWYSEENVPRLRQLKIKYDPLSLFSFYNPV